MKKIIPLLLFAVSAVAADIPVFYYPYDGCEPVDSTYAFADKDAELRRAGNRVLEDYVCGAYSGVMDLTSGNTLHLFPDKRAMLSEWCDICPKKLAAEGEWKIESGSVIVTWKKWYLDEKSKDFFVRWHGECTSLRLYLLFKPQRVVNSVLLISKDKEGAKIECPLVQRSRYIDWKNIADDLSKKRG